MALPRNVTFQDGWTVPALGQGTWYMGESPAHREAEIRALQTGIDAGLSLIDTAEMYADGGAEKVVGQAIAGRRQQVALVSKVLPSNASRHGMVKACEASLKRLGTDYLDLYLLHWRGRYRLSETVEAMQRLVQDGKIRRWGVSNLDLDDVLELTQVTDGERVQTDQVLYNLSRRGIEYDLLPWCSARGIPMMAYSPIEQGRILKTPALAAVAQRHGVSAAAVALAWTLRDPLTISIPKATSPQHQAENLAALDLQLTEADLLELDQAFPAPTRKVALEML